MRTPDICVHHRNLTRLLLPLLLCLTLIASAVGSVWAATAMALPMSAAATSSSPHDCHETAAATGDAGHERPTPASPCGDNQHCDCTQHCNVMPSSMQALLAEIPRARAPSPIDAGRDSVAPSRLNRPPIA